MIEQIAIIGSFAFLGAGLKYIDEVYDSGVFHQHVAWVLTLFCGLLMGLLISFDQYSSILLLGIILGVGITGKLDNISFHVVALLTILTPVIISVGGLAPGYVISFNLVATFVVMAASAIDEYVDKFGDRYQAKILTYRPFLKLTVVVLFLLGSLPLLYAFALLAFDLSYITVGVHSSRHVKPNKSLFGLSQKNYFEPSLLSASMLIDE